MVILTIGLFIILGYILFLFGPEISFIFGFGILAGGLFRGLYLLNEIHKRLSESDRQTLEAKPATKNENI
ncbi:hypothetical protein [Alkalihalobacillus sp. AL-G]|uniref:hypothetical protein n=1 Tax=Alkalihalobacillus sp. AL-G TaxID=2926399 RepID=UPI00272ACD9A|nr:hypothetical protein [Alkalihalobacillus sp. AL-G]WLD94617.1 hypothetical protein MOJ78_06955 [Alkalihalobacillus sp. AL-G]